jgi:hypothetical protein
VLCPAPECHTLYAASKQNAAVAEAIPVLELARHHVRDSFNIAMRVHRPDRARTKRIVIEDAQHADPHVSRVVVLVEREVPARVKPPAVGLVDVLVAADRQRSIRTSGHQASPPAISLDRLWWSGVSHHMTARAQRSWALSPHCFSPQLS